MIRVTITSNAAEVHGFLVRVDGEIKRPRALNDALGRRLARELQGHFRARNKEPNKLQAPKTNYWKQIADATAMIEATDSGAVVAIAEQRFRIQLFGGTIKPTGGRKFLTIPLVKEARAKRVAEYEKQSGKKLFRLPGSRVLVERSDKGDRSLASGSKGTIRGRDGYRKINIAGRTRLRPVYALKESVTFKEDPRALPPRAVLIAALSETADKWAARINGKGTSLA